MPPPFNGQVTVTVQVSGNVAFLSNGTPTVAPGRPIANAGVEASALNTGSGSTDDDGNCTITVLANLGETITVTAAATTYEGAAQSFTATGESASLEFVLPDNLEIIDQRCPLFDGTGSGAVDSQGNEYRYLARGYYYETTTSGQIQYFEPLGGGIYQCSTLSIELFPGDPNGEYDVGGEDFVVAIFYGKGVVYEQVGPGYYMTTGGAYFKPLP